METSSFNDFRERILKVRESRQHKVKNSWGVYDAYKYYRKHKPKEKEYIITEVQYFAIIRKINNMLAKELLKGNDVVFPERMGRIELRKMETNIKIEDGKIKTNMPVDWQQTLKLWYEDEESFKDKTLVKSNTKEVFRIYYNKSIANYNNKSFYDFSLNRKIKRTLKELINNGNLDAFRLWGKSGKIYQ